MASPHDSLFKETFSDVRNAAVELRAVLPPALLARIDLDSLAVEPSSFVDAELSAVHADIVYSVTLAGRRAYVYVLFEHQSTVDLLMPLRLLTYVVRILGHHVRDHDGALPLPVVIPVVLHHSEGGWTGARQFHELFDGELVAIDEVARLVPSFRFVLDDLSRASDEELRGRALREAERIVPLVLWAMRDARREQRLAASLVAWTAMVGEVLRSPRGRDALRGVIRYIGRVAERIRREDIIAAAEQAAPEVKEAIVTLAEQWIEEGLAKGLAKGRTEGQIEGRRALVTRLVTLKFGAPSAEHAARLATASVAELDGWAERVLSATAVDQVFGG